MKKSTQSLLVALFLIVSLFATTLLKAAEPPCPEDATISAELRLSEILLLESVEGKAVLWFTKYGSQEGESLYKWRYLGKGQSKELSGEGKVFEKYERTETSPGNFMIMDAGSQLSIHVGSITVKWSYGEEDASGYIYYDSKKLKATTIKQQNPANYKF